MLPADVRPSPIQSVKLHDFKFKQKKPAGQTTGYIGVKDGKTYLLKTDAEYQDCIISEFFVNTFGTLLTPGTKCFPKSTLIRNEDYWWIATKWIKNTEPIKWGKVDGNIQIDRFDPEIAEPGCFFTHGGRYIYMPKNKELKEQFFTIYCERHEDFETGFHKYISCGNDHAPASIKLEEPEKETLCYKGRPIKNLSRIITVIKILSLIDIECDHFLIKDKKDHYRATLIDTNGPLSSRLNHEDIMYPFVSDQDKLCYLPYLEEKEVWKTVDDFLALTKAKIREVFSSVPNLLDETDIDEWTQSILKSQTYLRKNRNAISEKSFHEKAKSK